ncbi:Holliday junction resolvase RuvX [Helicobacter sp. MIT 99-5507]|uniref:Holliday junction resolvase RuvX n=1 Tax=Helicobacter sp. MIT 99-5507 TaxID=152489 RepID=UPI000E1F84A5|nr:Holliday junction resolvase RuvX [Helicobacter sp. MIT 99-5507]RDU58032.1 Holliday junction resolvase RuvX [Helicobacter sp. MIT 99-5507]
MIAIDFGLKKIGIAQYINGIILPLAPIIRRNRNDAAKRLNELLIEKNTKILIIGIANEEMQRRINHFITLLNFSGEIKFVDESLSSKEAEEMLQNRDNSHIMRKNGTIDSISAMIIMQRYLKSN